jgi:protein-glutamine gamma-glutamyltransferase
MKPPPLLLGAALLFWGWQAGFLAVGALMAVALEGARWIEARWEFSDEDFTRIWTFCTLLFLAAAVYAFTSNEGPADFRGFFQNPNFFTQRNAGASSARTAASLLRWVPMVFYLFMAAQVYSSREGIPLRTLSLILSARWKKARKLGQFIPADRSVNISYPYFALCLLAASFHSNENRSFFWGLCALVGWGLWSQRARRFSVVVWGLSLAAAIGLGYLGERGLGNLQNYIASLNPQWLAGFARHRFDATQNRTELGSLGRLKTSGRIVIRLEAKEGAPPPLLREASYRSYKRRTWFAELSENDFEKVPAEANETTYVLLHDKTNSATANIACYLPRGQGLLPLPTGCGRLENLMAYILQKSGLGAVSEQGPGLVVFDARFGPGATLDQPPDTNLDLALPPREIPALNQIAAELRLSEQTPEQAVRTVGRFFAEKFSYSTWQEPASWRRTNETALTRFLLRNRSGHCEYFATAGVLLLRRAGIPARYAVGWAVHEGTGGGKYVVRQRDAHAWCLVWSQKNAAWHDWDFTPGSWVRAETAHASPLQFLSDWWSRLSFELSKFRWGQSHLRQYFLWALAPILTLLLYQIVFRSRHRQQRRVARAEAEARDWPGLDSEFYQLEQRLVRRGLLRERGEPLSDWLQRLRRDPDLDRLQATLQELLLLHYRYRFDPRGLGPGERDTLRRRVTLCLAQVE